MAGRLAASQSRVTSLVAPSLARESLYSLVLHNHFAWIVRSQSSPDFHLLGHGHTLGVWDKDHLLCRGTRHGVGATAQNPFKESHQIQSLHRRKRRTGGMILIPSGNQIEARKVHYRITSVVVSLGRHVKQGNTALVLEPAVQGNAVLSFVLSSLLFAAAERLMVRTRTRFSMGYSCVFENATHACMHAWIDRSIPGWNPAYIIL